MKLNLPAALLLTIGLYAEEAQQPSPVQNPQQSTQTENVDVLLQQLFGTQKPKKSSAKKAQTSLKNTPPKKSKSAASMTPSPSQAKNYWLFPDQDHQSLVSLEYLFWTVSEPGLYFASTKRNAVPGLAETPATPPQGDSSPTVYQMGEIHNAHFGWSSGFRLLGGHQFKNTPWFVAAEYTYYKTSDSSTIHRPSTTYGYLTGMDTLQETQTLADKASSHTHLRYDHLQALFGTALNPIPALKVTFSMGASATWLDQVWKVKFTPNPTSYTQDSTTYTGNYALDYKKDHTWGFGLITGLGGDAHLGQGMSLGVNTAISGLVGQTSDRSRGQLTPLNSLSFISTDTTEFNIYQSPEYRFMGQIMLNTRLGWSRSYNHFAARVELGYEFNALINMLDIYREGDSNTGLQTGKAPSFSSIPIYLHGMTLRVGFGF